jgi:hypothetical protein
MKKGVDPVLIFWKAFAIFKEGSVTEAIRELESIQHRREVTFAVSVALVHYHEQCQIVDRVSPRKKRCLTRFLGNGRPT